MDNDQTDNGLPPNLAAELKQALTVLLDDSDREENLGASQGPDQVGSVLDKLVIEEV